ncbi:MULTISPECIES: helix-turn-helix transcriptional regulator [unclassified Arthrobacter]|uniref:helix-turn-helix transcriptional regulator n=1 Tax=unclassified Arthrobacter TaxID=235627 RepID=UPI001490E014|nr:helix-turn-helix transcriptional regulator [Arthrobacter sp. AET 35A]MBE0010273.1 XRE family transcriptional regulator [Arthrobacter sp. AET 35A]NOJ64150.1 helix-turn-helix domain-containing protein [Arthrobacter sp. 147(2020)]
MPADRTALAAFLRTRRDRLTPAQAGIDPLPGRRRVLGLRKEEVAHLASLSTDHYSRIEQGRQQHLSSDIVLSLSRALRLDEIETKHLFDLAVSPAKSRDSGWEAPQRADPGLLRLLTTLDHVPALLLGRRGDVLARNGLLCTVLGTELDPGSSFMRWLFQAPEARERILNWSDFAAAAVGGLRYETGRRPYDRKLETLVAKLRTEDPDVARWWNDHGVTDQTSVTKRIEHPHFGILVFGIEAVNTPHDPDQRLIVYTVEPDSATAALLPLLQSWAAQARSDPSLSTPRPE